MLDGVVQGAALALALVVHRTCSMGNNNNNDDDEDERSARFLSQVAGVVALVDVTQDLAHSKKQTRTKL